MTFWFKSKPKHTHTTNIISISSQKVQTQKYGQEEREAYGNSGICNRKLTSTHLSPQGNLMMVKQC